ncbi:CinA family nicotinamide mononucleotide deamidase-related protein [Photobacterium nomapromontoriensis]|uniref:CinA family nicotinamide mononucleotide deamidase-related protein n=1 Tax=Photobacterium nomapromontoriensis TaxID=2910237 RepID=UPI003D0E8343
MNLGISLGLDWLASEESMLEVVMISTGDEVLYGDIDDTNAAWLSRLFFDNGVMMTRRTTIGDQLDRLAKEIEYCSLTADIVIVNGGLGPTTDDLTAQAAAIAADVGLELSSFWVDAMRDKYAKLEREMPETNLKQAMLPEGAELLDNPVGTACGFAMRLNRAWLFFTPGVPSEFKLMSREKILPRILSTQIDHDGRECHRLYTFGLSESGIGQTLQSLVLPEGCELGYRSSLPFIEVKLFAPQGHSQVPALYQDIAAKLGNNVVGEGRSLLPTIGAALNSMSLQLAVTEDHSGGMVMNRLSDDELCAQALAQGWLLKQPRSNQVLSVEESLLDVEAMALAAKDKANVSLALAVGHSAEQGVTIALATEAGIWSQCVVTRRIYSSQDHRVVITTAVLDMLRRFLTNKPVIGHYESIDCILSRHIPNTIDCR